MTPKEIFTMLNSISTSIPVFYHHADSGTKVPFIEWTYASTDNFSADNKTYIEVFDCEVILYSKTKDMDSEALIKAKLTDYDIPFSHEENYIDDEKLYQEIYTFSVVDSPNNTGGN